MNEPDSSTNQAGDGLRPEEDELSLIRILNVLLRHRWLLVLLPIVLMVALAASSLSKSRSYAAYTSFMPQGSEASSVGGVGVLARQLGVNIGSEGGPESPMFYSRLLNTRELLWQAIVSEYDVSDTADAVRSRTLLELWGIRDASEREQQRRAVSTLRERIGVTVDRETGLVGLTVRASPPVLAEQIAERLIQLVNLYNLEQRQSRARAEHQFVEERLQEAQVELHEAESELQVFLRQNRMFRDSPELTFEHDRLQRQVSLRQELVNALSQARERARIDAVREAPVITVVEAAAGSARPQPRGTVARVVLGGISGLAIAILLAFFLEFMSRIGRKNDPDYSEFNALRRTAWEEIRHPRRLLKRQQTLSR